MRKAFSRTITLSVLFLLALSPCTSHYEPMQIAYAVVGTVSTLANKAIVNVSTRYYLTGTGWTPGAPFWYQWRTANMWNTTLPPAQAGFAADSAGNIPPTAYLDLAAATVETYYILLSQSSDGTAGVAYVAITARSTGPSFMIGTTSGTPGDALEDITGSGFTVGQSVKLCLGSKVLTTLAVASNGTISGLSSLPDVPGGTYGVWAFQTDGLAARYGATGSSFLLFTVNPGISVDKTSISGELGETFKITGRGWTPGEHLQNPLVAGVPASFYPSTVTPIASSEATFTATVYLSSRVATYGPAAIRLTGSSTGVQTFSNAVMISTPAAVGDEGVSSSDTSCAAGKSFQVHLWNWPSTVSVDLYLGGAKTGTVTTDANGAARGASVIVAVVSGGTYMLTAKYPAQGLVATCALTVAAALALNVEGKWVADDTEMIVEGRGYGAEERVEVKDTAVGGSQNVIKEGRLIAVMAGTKDGDYIKTTVLGSFQLKYKAKIAVSTASTVTVTATGLTSAAVSARTYRALKKPGISLSAAWARRGEIITLTFTDLKPDTEYQLYLSGALLTLIVGTETRNSFMTDTTGASPVVTFTVPDLQGGTYPVDLVYSGAKTVIATVSLKVSVPATTAYITVSPTALVSLQSMTIRGFNFKAAETSVAVNLVGIGQLSLFPGVNPVGGFEFSQGIPASSLPAGTYAVYVTRAAGEPAVTPVPIAVRPKLSASPTDGLIGAPFKMSGDGLEPNTIYVVIWGVATDVTPSVGTVLTGSRFTTDSKGAGTSPPLTVPTVVTGDYYITVAPLAVPTALVTPYGTDGKAAFPKFTVKAPTGLTVSGSPGSFIPLQQVRVVWEKDINETGLAAPLAINAWIILGDTRLSAGASDYEYVPATSRLKLYLSFGMPNGDPATLTLKVKFEGKDSRSVAFGPYTSEGLAIERTTGSGALLVGVDTAADIAYIKTKTETATVKLAELDAKIVATNGTAALISTNVGLLSAKVEDIKARVASVEGDVATVRTDIGNLTGKIVTIQGNIATITTNVGTITTDISTAKTTTASIRSVMDTVSLLLYGTVISALIAAIAAIVNVVRRTGMITCLGRYNFRSERCQECVFRITCRGLKEISA